MILMAGGEHKYLCDHYVDGKVMLPVSPSLAMPAFAFYLLA